MAHDHAHHAGAHAQGHGDHQHTATPYVLVWIALLAFTAITVVTGKMHLGAWALPLALLIASTKSILVLLFFMHLWEQKGANRLVVVVSFLFVFLLMGITMLDVATRFKPSTPAGAPFGAKVHLPEESGEHAPHGAPVH